jgi:dihydroflavonol-4-reductase
MRILVTGATGFIGAKLCRGLVGRDHAVIAFHRPTSSLKALQGIPVEHKIGDVTSPEDLRAAMQGVDVVYHLAAPPQTQAGSGKLYATLVEGTRYVLKAALEAGVQRVIYTSAAAAIGAGKRLTPLQQPEVLDENHVWNLPPQRWPFGYAKYLAEMEVQKAVGLGLPVIVLNPTFVLGSGEQKKRNQSALASLAANPLPFYLSGGINIVHVSDVVRAHMAALSFGNIGERYLLAGKNLQLRYFQELAAKTLGHEGPRFLLPSNLAKAGIPFLHALRALVDLPFDEELLRLTGLWFYYSGAKSLKDLKLPPYRDADNIIHDALT